MITYPNVCLLLCVFQNVTNAENICIVTDDVRPNTTTYSDDPSQLTLIAGQLVEVLSAPAPDDISQDTCYVRVVTSAEGRDVSAGAATDASSSSSLLLIEGWVPMATLRPQTNLTVQGGTSMTIEGQGQYNAF